MNSSKCIHIMCANCGSLYYFAATNKKHVCSLNLIQPATSVLQSTKIITMSYTTENQQYDYIVCTIPCHLPLILIDLKTIITCTLTSETEYPHGDGLSHKLAAHSRTRCCAAARHSLRYLEGQAKCLAAPTLLGACWQLCSAACAVCE